MTWLEDPRISSACSLNSVQDFTSSDLGPDSDCDWLVLDLVVGQGLEALGQDAAVRMGNQPAANLDRAASSVCKTDEVALPIVYAGSLGRNCSRACSVGPPRHRGLPSTSPTPVPCTRSCLRNTAHPMPLRVCFAEGSRRHLNALVRQFCLAHECFSNSLSQHVRLTPGACTANDQRHQHKKALDGSSALTDRPDGETPFSTALPGRWPIAHLSAGLSRPSSGARDSRPADLPDLRLLLSARITVLPEELDRPEVRGLQVSSFGWLAGFRATGGVCATPQQDRFALFSTTTHVQTHTMRRGITLEALVAEVRSILPNLRSVRFLSERLAGLPAVQVAATTREDPGTGQATPVDLRPVGGRICTLASVPGMTARDTMQEIAACPAIRQATEDFRLQLPDGRH